MDHLTAKKVSVTKISGTRQNNNGYFGRIMSILAEIVPKCQNAKRGDAGFCVWLKQFLQNNMQKQLAEMLYGRTLA